MTGILLFNLPVVSHLDERGLSFHYNYYPAEPSETKKTIRLYLNWLFLFVFFIFLFAIRFPRFDDGKVHRPDHMKNKHLYPFRKILCHVHEGCFHRKSTYLEAALVIRSTCDARSWGLTIHPRLTKLFFVKCLTMGEVVTTPSLDFHCWTP